MAMTYLLVDGENIDATLGNSILGRRPTPEERPRWDRLLGFAQDTWGQPAHGLFFLNASSGLPMSFVQALRALGYVPVPLSGSGDQKVVDMAIQKTLEALADRDEDVMLVSHDGDFLETVEPLLDGERRVGVVAFEEFRNSGFAPLRAQGLEFFDLEHDTKAFNAPLPRLRIIPIEDFDPLQFL
ncbi:NYN domain-containing protein [Ornithinimicrobium panacihumi]|uniref:NYN domain-containing protein n=1 Tax=Ornithinimicrobium panacihumi TaxID=2008449 RepID=UPI003F8C1712